MKIDTLKLVCFSPTGTTRKIANAIAQTAGFENTERIDITKVNARKQIVKTCKNELLLVAAPSVYGAFTGIGCELAQCP